MVSASRPAAAVVFLAAVTAGTAANQGGPELKFRQHEHQPRASPMLPPFLEGQPEAWQVRPERTALGGVVVHPWSSPSWKGMCVHIIYTTAVRGPRGDSGRRSASRATRVFLCETSEQRSPVWLA